MKAVRSKVQYGQLDESSRSETSTLDFNVRSCSLSNEAAHDRKGGKALSSVAAASPTTAIISIGPGGKVMTQDLQLQQNPASKDSKYTTCESSSPKAREGSRKKSSTTKRQRRKDEIIMGWQRNPRKHGDENTAVPPPPVQEKSEPRQLTPHVRQKKLSQTGEKRRKQRQEIIMEWQRNPPAGGANIAVLLPVQNEPKPQEESPTVEVDHNEGEKVKENDRTWTPSHKQRELKLTSSSSTKREHHHRGRKHEDSGKGKEPRSDAPTSSRKPAHLRVYRSTNAGRTERSRSRSRNAKRRPRQPREETTLLWKRETAKKEVSTDVKVEVPSQRVDKATLGEVTKILEKQKKYEEDKREAIGKLRGRKYRSGGPIARAEGTSTRRGAGSRSPVPPARGRGRKTTTDTTVNGGGREMQFTWQREPAQRSNFVPRRKPHRTVSGDGIASANKKPATESCDSKPDRRFGNQFAKT